MATLPTLPQLTVDTTYPSTLDGLVNGSTFIVNSGGSIQTAIDNAVLADGNLNHQIVLQTGATFTIAAESLALRKKNGANPNGNGWIIIRSAGLFTLLSPQGRRIAPSDASNMSKIATTNAAGPFWIGAEFGAHHYWFAGVELSQEYTGSAGIATTIIQLGYDMVGNQATSLTNLTKDFVFDRCYVHGTTTGNITRGIIGNVQRFAAVDCYFDEFHLRGGDGQCLAFWNTPGPIKLDNNYFAATTENVLFGGSSTRLSPNTNIADITVTRNYFKKYLKWYPNDPSYAGILWQVKNNFELKHGIRVLIEGNIMENDWEGGGNQHGNCIVFTPRDDDGLSSWVAVQDVTFRYNKVLHGGAGFNCQGSDTNATSQQLQRVHIHNCVIDDMLASRGGGYLFHGIYSGGFGAAANTLGTGVKDLTVDHVTAFYDVGNAWCDTGSTNHQVLEEMDFKNSIVPKRTLGFFGTGSSDGDPTFTAHFFVDPLYTKNVMAGSSAAAYTNHSGNFFPLNDAGVGFVNQAGGNYRLAPSSPFKNAGLDGLDPGCDIDTLETKTAGCITGIWSAVVVTPATFPFFRGISA